MNKANVIRREACPACRKKGLDSKGDNLAIYLNEDKTESAFCFSCNYTRASSEYKNNTYENKYEYETYNMSGEFTIYEWTKFKESSGADPKGWRGLTKDTCTTYGVRHQYTEKGVVSYQYYPITSNNELVGLKWRSVDKKWYNKGLSDSTCDLFGKISFLASSSKNVIIASGEIEALTIYQILNEYFKSKGWETPPVVSSICGEGALSQFRNNYDWLNKYEKIIICPDQDEPGLTYLHKLAQVLPRNKVFVMELPLKDANECLTKGKSKAILDAYFKARAYTPSGVKGSDTAYRAMVERSKLQKVSFPDYAHKLNDMLAGGVPFGYIVNLVAGCVDCQTEFLSQDGWKPISEYNETDLVLQYDVMRESASFVKPYEYIKQPCNTLNNFYNSEGLSQVLSDEHRILVNYAYNYTTGFKDILAKDFMKIKKLHNDVDYRYYSTFNLNNKENEVDIDSFIKDALFIQSYTKNFNNNLYNLTSKQAAQIVKLFMEYYYKESSPSLYYNTNKKIVDFLQFVLAAQKIRSSLKQINDRYYLTIHRETPSVSYSNFECQPVFTTDGFKYCFRVPSGYLVLRKNGNIFITGNSGSGKSTLINDFVRHRIYQQDFKCGIISTEADEAEYGENLFSAHLGTKIALMDDLSKQAFFDSNETEEEAKKFFTASDGSPSYYIIDDRGDYDTIQSKIEELIIKCGCTVLVCDVLTDLLAGKDISYQEKFIAFQKALVKQYPIIILNVIHTRKGASGQQSASGGAIVDEESMIGSGSQYRSAGINLSLRRNKMAETDIARNTVQLYVFKNRAASKLGMACELFYDINTARLQDLDDYKLENPAMFEQEDY